MQRSAPALAWHEASQAIEGREWGWGPRRASPRVFLLPLLQVERRRPPSTGSPESSQESREKSLKGEGSLQRVQAIAGNEGCCDCGQADPRWASINLGITLCIECSGIHRWASRHSPFPPYSPRGCSRWGPPPSRPACPLPELVPPVCPAGAWVSISPRSGP